MQRVICIFRYFCFWFMLMYLYVYIYTVYVTTKCCACYMLISPYIAIYIGTIGCQFAEHKCKFGEVPIETGIPNVKVTLAKNSCHSLLNHWGWKMYCWESGRCYVSFRTCIFWSFVRLVLNKCWSLLSSKNMKNMFPSEVMTETYWVHLWSSVLVDFL